MNRFIIFALICAVGCAATAVQAQEPADYGALFLKYVKAVNTGDAAALSALISDDVERSDYRACTPAMSNKDCLMLYVQTTVMHEHGNIAPTGSFGADGDTLYGGLILKSDRIRSAGSTRAFGIDKIKVKDGKIAGLKFLPNLQDPQTKKFFDYIRSSGMPSSQPYINR